MTDALAEPYDYDDNSYGRYIPDFARDLKAKVIRIKGDPDTGTKLGESSAGRFEREAAAFFNLAASPRKAVADSLSGAVADPGDGLQGTHPPPQETGSS
ncbi:hypothetical protein VTO73DRAFT_2424 [Trametes versicolor]